MMLRLLTLLCLLLPVPSWAAITCTTTDFGTNEGAASTTLTITKTIPSQTFRRPVAVIFDRSDETTTISSVTDNNGGTWTVRRTATDMSTAATGRFWFYEQSTLGGTGSTTLTVTFSAAINSSGVFGTCYSDTASLDYVSTSAVNEHTTTTTWTAPSRTYTATGVIIGDMATASGNCVFSSVGTNQTVMNTASFQAHIVVRLESSGTQGLDGTTSFNCTGMWGSELYQEASASEETFGLRRRLLQ